VNQPVYVPKIDANVTRATVVEWLAREGDRVGVGTPLVELETEKAVYTVEAEVEGVLAEVLVPAGERVPVGTCLATITAKGGAGVADLGDVGLGDVVPCDAARGYVTPGDVGRGYVTPGDVGIGYVTPTPRAENPRDARDERGCGVIDEYAIDDYSDALFGPPPAVRDDTGTMLPANLPPPPTGRNEPGVLIVGAGRHAIEVIDALLARGIAIHGCLDARVPIGKEIYPGVRVVGHDRDLAAMSRNGFRTAYIGIGGFENLPARIRMFHAAEELGMAAGPLIHPSAHVAPSSHLSAGTTVLAHASIGPMNRIGRNCVITQNAAVSHHCCIGHNVVISPNAALAAGVVIEDDATIGMGVTVHHDVHVGSRATIVSGLHVTADVPADGTMKRDTSRHGVGVACLAAPARNVGWRSNLPDAPEG